MHQSVAIHILLINDDCPVHQLLRPQIQLGSSDSGSVGIAWYDKRQIDMQDFADPKGGSRERSFTPEMKIHCGTRRHV